MTRLHPGAYADHLSRALPLSEKQPLWSDGDGTLPALYFGHGAPPLLDDPLWLGQLFDWVLGLPKPRAVLIVSAHWEAAPLSLSASEAGTPLVYDFGGFEQRFYEVQYPTPDASALAAEVAALMPDNEPVHQHTSRGLDHGAFVPLMAMYPMADVPVLQLSLPTHDPETLLAVGRRLRPLREQGVLVMGSGFLTHGLPFLSREHWVNPDSTPPGWSQDFDSWAGELLARGDVGELMRYASVAPGMPYAHPTVEHLSPLFVTLGAATDPEQPVGAVIDGFWMGLSKRALQVA
ncbi:MAG: dioxygenase [Actinomycetales bacterium]